MDPEQRIPWDFIPSQSKERKTCDSSAPAVSQCPSTWAGHRSLNCVMEGVGSSQPLAQGSHPQSSTCSSHCSCIQSYLHWAYSSKLTTLLHPTHFILGIIKLGLIPIYLFFSKSLGPCASLSSMNIFSKQDIWVYLCCSGLLQLFNWLDHMLL